MAERIPLILSSIDGEYRIVELPEGDRIPTTAASGAQGFQGEIGVSGAQGAQGADGSGAQGTQGDPGAQGDQGPSGVQGPLGNQGSQGDRGDQGEIGVQGNAGATGDQGASGVQGAQGSQGSQGNQGASGTQGLAGATGDQGASGAQGVQGSQGSQGNQGASGTQGLAGATGDQGPSGAQGVQGSQGNQGNQGASGTQGLAGATGDQGASGIQGYTGPQGDRGLQGEIGVQGNAGPDGDQGPSGAQGAQGNAGANGLNGANGSQGDPGASGAQGNQGPDGDQGPQGAQGPQGPCCDRDKMFTYTSGTALGTGQAGRSQPPVTGDITDETTAFRLNFTASDSVDFSGYMEQFNYESNAKSEYPMFDVTVINNDTEEYVVGYFNRLQYNGPNTVYLTTFKGVYASYTAGTWDALDLESASTFSFIITPRYEVLGPFPDSSDDPNNNGPVASRLRVQSATKNINQETTNGIYEGDFIYYNDGEYKSTSMNIGTIGGNGAVANLQIVEGAAGTFTYQPAETAAKFALGGTTVQNNGPISLDVSATAFIKDSASGTADTSALGFGDNGGYFTPLQIPQPFYYANYTTSGSTGTSFGFGTGATVRYIHKDATDAGGIDASNAITQITDGCVVSSTGIYEMEMNLHLDTPDNQANAQLFFKVNGTDVHSREFYIQRLHLPDGYIIKYVSHLYAGDEITCGYRNGTTSTAFAEAGSYLYVKRIV